MFTMVSSDFSHSLTNRRCRIPTYSSSASSSSSSSSTSSDQESLCSSSSASQSSKNASDRKVHSSAISQKRKRLVQIQLAQTEFPKWLLEAFSFSFNDFVLSSSSVVKPSSIVAALTQAHAILDRIYPFIDSRPIQKLEPLELVARYVFSFLSVNEASQSTSGKKNRQSVKRFNHQHDWLALLSALKVLESKGVLESNRFCSSSQPNNRILTQALERLQRRLEHMLRPRPISVKQDSYIHQSPLVSKRYRQSLASDQAKANVQCAKIALKLSCNLSHHPLDYHQLHHVGHSLLERVFLGIQPDTLILDVANPEQFDQYTANVQNKHHHHHLGHAHPLLPPNLKNVALFGTRKECFRTLQAICVSSFKLANICLVEVHSSISSTLNEEQSTQIEHIQDDPFLIQRIPWILPPNVTFQQRIESIASLLFFQRSQSYIVTSVKGSIRSDQGQDSSDSVPGLVGNRRKNQRARDKLDLLFTTQESQNQDDKNLRTELEHASLENSTRLVTIVRAYDKAGKEWLEQQEKTNDVEKASQEHSEGQSSTSSAPRLFTKSLPTLTDLCIQRLIQTTSTEEHVQAINTIPVHARWLFECAYKCLECGQVVLPPHGRHGTAPKFVSKDQDGQTSIHLDSPLWCKVAPTYSDHYDERIEQKFGSDLRSRFSSQGTDWTYGWNTMFCGRKPENQDTTDFSSQNLDSEDEVLELTDIRKTFRYMLDVGFLPSLREKINLIIPNLEVRTLLGNEEILKYNNTCDQMNQRSDLIHKSRDLSPRQKQMTPGRIRRVEKKLTDLIRLRTEAFCRIASVNVETVIVGGKHLVYTTSESELYRAHDTSLPHMIQEEDLRFCLSCFRKHFGIPKPNYALSRRTNNNWVRFKKKDVYDGWDDGEPEFQYASDSSEEKVRTDLPENASETESGKSNCQCTLCCGQRGLLQDLANAKVSWVRCH